MQMFSDDSCPGWNIITFYFPKLLFSFTQVSQKYFNTPTHGVLGYYSEKEQAIFPPLFKICLHLEVDINHHLLLYRNLFKTFLIAQSIIFLLFFEYS